MKKTISVVTFYILSIYAFGQAIITFNGEPLSAYIGQTVEFQQTLYVCGRYNHQLYLSYERLRQAEECAVYGSSAYDSIQSAHSTAILTAYCPNVLTDSIRLGSTLTNLEAIVTGTRAIRIEGNLMVGNNTRPTVPPSLGDARLIVCAANLEYYCPEWQDTYGAGSDDEFAIQRTKTIKALANIGADIFAFAEIQQGAVALQSLIDGLNDATTAGRYAYVADNDTVTTTYTKVGFIFRTDKVAPILNIGHPYGPAANSYQMQSGYHKRMLVQCFEELSTHERFVLCMNHFKSKSGGDSTNNYYNSTRIENAEHLTDFIDAELQNRYYSDEDILIVGDLNCGSMEDPILHFQSNGYTNMLTQFSPNEYSYTFNNEVEYLDHVLASTSLQPQITAVVPYHINTDESYKYYYTYGDTSMYRYSDHDPILIGLRLSSETEEACYNYEFSESFAQSFGSFEAQNVSGNSYWYTYSNYECACVNGYSTGNNEDWLISPSFDLSDKNEAMLTFEQTLGYGSIANWGSHCQLMMSSDYHGNISAATWDVVDITLPVANWNWVENSLRIPEHFQQQPNLTIAFKYQVAVGDIPSWEIRNFVLQAECREDSTGNMGLMTNENNFRIHSHWGTIEVETLSPCDIIIYDLTGRIIKFANHSDKMRCNLPTGLYIVRVGKQVQKVVVQ